MTADQRLDQLEPIISEAITILDRHTAQLKQLSNAVGTLTDSAIKQSDGISYLLTEVILIKDRLTNLENDVAALKNDVAELKGDVAELKGDVAEIKQGQQAMQAEFGSKLDLILTKLQ